MQGAVWFKRVPVLGEPSLQRLGGGQREARAAPSSRAAWARVRTTERLAVERGKH